MEARLLTAKQVSEIVGFKRTKLLAMTKVNE
jgi:predicted DNA-binding transcriptional regulator AlpA